MSFWIHLPQRPLLRGEHKDIGTLAINKTADICVARANNKKSFEAFYSINPGDLLLVIHKGEIVLFDSEIKNQLIESNLSFSSFSKVCMNGKIKYVLGNVTQLMIEILTYYPEAVFPVDVPAYTKR